VVLRDIVVGSRIKTKEQQVCHTEDFLVAEIDAKEGGFGIVPSNLEGAIVSNHYFLFDINREMLDPAYLNMFIRTSAFQNQVRAQGSTNYAAIKPEDVLGYKIPLPSIHSQKTIVNVLQRLLIRIQEIAELRRSSMQKVDEVMNSVLHHFFDLEHTEHQVKNLGSLCRTQSGGTPSRDRPDFYAGGIPWIKSGELRDNVITSSEETISDSGLAESSAKLFPRGTLVVALYGATVGRTGILGIDASTNQAVCALFPNMSLDRDYLWWFLRYMRPNFLARSFGGAQPNISQRSLHESRIPLPPLHKQTQIVGYLDLLHSKLEELGATLSEGVTKIDGFFPSALSVAFKTLL